MSSRRIIEKLGEASSLLHKRIPDLPKIVFVLGSGLGELCKEIKDAETISLNDLIHVKPSTVEGHSGTLVVGTLFGNRILCMRGRLHYYEGYSMEEVVFPVRLLAHCGAETFILTNAAASLSPSHRPTDFVLIKDHINLMGNNPLIGLNDSDLGSRFVALNGLYDLNLRNLFLEASKKIGKQMKEGVYVGISGPHYETPAEIKMHQIIGGDMVGMSTVPEAIALKHMNRRVVGISCITNVASGLSPHVPNHLDVLNIAQKSYPFFLNLISETLPKIG